MSNQSTLVPIGDLPTDVSMPEAVLAAYGKEINAIDEALRQNRSVLVECDKDVTLYLMLAIRDRFRRDKANAPRLALVDGRPDPNPEVPYRGNLPRMMEQLMNAVRGSTENTVVVMPYLDVLATTFTGLTVEAREMIPLLYENPEVVILAFRDPSFEVPKIVKDHFTVRFEIVGIPRECLTKIVAQREARSMHATEFDPYGLYKYVSGLNVVTFRKMFQRVGTRREAPQGRPLAQEVYREIRKQTAPADEAEFPNVSLEKDIGGYEPVKTKFREELFDLLEAKNASKDPDKVAKLEKLIPRGIIFYGPPGTGKTYFAKALATKINASIIVVSGPELKSKWVGASEENLRRVFRQARATAPCVIVFDEIDSFATQRGTYQGSGVEHSMVNQLLTEMDGFRSNESIFIVATTNFLESVDSALMRPGRFELHIEIPAPSAVDRTEIVGLYNKRLNLGMTEPVIKHAVRRTEGYADKVKGVPFSGDHLQALARALSRKLLRSPDGYVLGTGDVDEALQRKLARPIILSPEEERIIAIHEAGHALVSMLLPKATRPERICIAQDQEGALGYVQRAARARPYAVSSGEFLADIAVAFGGREAERLFVGDVSVGAAQDLQVASQIARAYVGVYGMSDTYGPSVVIDDRPSQAQAAEIDAEVKRVLLQEQAVARDLLAKHADLHRALTDLLLERKVLEATDITAFHDSHPA